MAKAPVLDGLPHRWWPVDSDFWHRWFHHDFVVAKISRNLYIWRQYSAQSTRTHNRCSLEQLRRCSAFFVAAVLEGKFAPSISEIRVYGVGQTLEAWKSAIQLEFAEQNGADETRVFSPHKPGEALSASKGRRLRSTRLRVRHGARARQGSSRHLAMFPRRRSP